MNVVALNNSDRATEEAVDWFIRQDGDSLSDDERRAFEAWRKVPANALAYERVRKVWGDFEGAPHPDEHSAAPVATAPTARARGKWRAVRLAASIAAGVLLFVFGSEVRLRALADHRTAVGQIRTIPLPDGSTLTLNTDSAVALDFNASSRTVRLLEGEAVFEVAPDAGRPFVVEAANGSTRALGTVFEVRQLDSGARITGIEHRVAVTYAGASTATLGAGEQIQYSASGGLSRVTPAVPMSDAWRRGRLIIENRPLAEVVEELNRYSPSHIQLVGARLGELRVNGVFPLMDPDSSLRALEQSLGIRSTRITRYLVLLTRE